MMCDVGARSHAAARVLGVGTTHAAARVLGILPRIDWQERQSVLLEPCRREHLFPSALLGQLAAFERAKWLKTKDLPCFWIGVMVWLGCLWIWFEVSRQLFRFFRYDSPGRTDRVPCDFVALHDIMFWYFCFFFGGVQAKKTKQW